jgi:Tfp pilus assembly protein PilF
MPGSADRVRSGSTFRDRTRDQSIAATDPRTQSKPVLAAQQQVAQAEVRRQGLASKLSESRRLRTPTRLDPAAGTSLRTFHSDPVDRRSSLYLHARYYDRPDLIGHSYHHVHTYYDSYYHLHHRIIWPTYYYPVCYPFGSYISFHYVWPYYHRKYVFISLGGYWPDDCYSVRYYWYGWHPYVWYGYYPVAREVVADSDTYYYTYNYYQSDGTVSSVQTDQPMDESTWAEVQAKLDRQKAQPGAQTLADTRFEEGVKSFESGDFNTAAKKFAEAMAQAPDDMILPFAYTQALFADGQYAEAAHNLRVALAKVTPDKEGVFFPRGLYANDDVLFAQVEKLVDRLDRSADDADLQLLLGYQLLGVGETGYAREPLERAVQDPKNAEAAQILLKMLEKVESKAGATSNADSRAAGIMKRAEGKGESDTQTPATPAPQTPGAIGAQLSNTPEPDKQAAPKEPSQDSSDANEVEIHQTAPDKAGAAGVQNKAEQPADRDDGGGIVPTQRNDTNSTVGGPKLSANAGANMALGSLQPAVRIGVPSLMDYAGLGLMTLLGCLAVGIQWRHVNDWSVRSLFGHRG